MKKLLAILLAAVMCISFCACGGKELPVNTAETTQAPTIESKSFTAESISGNYKSLLWFSDDSITLNANTTYDLKNGEKGTFSIIDDTTLQMTSAENSYDKEEYVIGDNCLYIIEHWNFSKDKEYGLAFSPDENGMTDQSFEATIIGSNIPGSIYNWIFLNLDKDGIFELKLGDREQTSLEVGEIFEGTYKFENSTLTLTYNGKEYPLIVNSNNVIYFLIYNKE